MADPSEDNRPIDSSVVLGKYTNTGKDISITGEERLRGISVVGAAGTGKSTLLTSMAQQVIAKGECVVLIAVEPDIINDLLVRIPQERMKDVIYLDLSVRDRFIG